MFNAIFAKLSLILLNKFVLETKTYYNDHNTNFRIAYLFVSLKKKIQMTIMNNMFYSESIQFQKKISFSKSKYYKS
jgi:hypothetical protein